MPSACVPPSVWVTKFHTDTKQQAKLQSLTKQCSVISDMIWALSTTTVRNSSFLASDLLQIGITGEYPEKSHVPWSFLRFTKLLGVVPCFSVFQQLWYTCVIFFMQHIKMEQETKIYYKRAQDCKYRQFLSCVRVPFLKHYVTRNLCLSELTPPPLIYYAWSVIQVYVYTASVYM